ncbi:MAG: hypothetical protein ACYTFY_10885 [Planctomycetota bacterium]|jgi:hypothetical protein
MSIFLAGASEITITPPAGVDLAGYNGRKGQAEGIHHELKAVAVVNFACHNAAKLLSINLQ